MNRDCFDSSESGEQRPEICVRLAGAGRERVEVQLVRAAAGPVG